MNVKSKSMAIIGAAMLAVLVGSLGFVGVQLAYAQETGNVVDSTAALFGSLAAAVAAVGTILATLGPWVKKWNKKLGEGLENVGADAIKVNHYLLTLAEQAKKNKATIDILKEAVLQMGHATPEQRAALADVETKISRAEQSIEEEIDHQREQLAKLQSIITSKSISEDELDQEKTL